MKAKTAKIEPNTTHTDTQTTTTNQQQHQPHHDKGNDRRATIKIALKMASFVVHCGVVRYLPCLCKGA